MQCAYCGTAASEEVRLEADHFLPLALGGPDTIDNLLPACPSCNRGPGGKFHRDPWEWLTSRFPERVAALRGAQTYRQVGES